MFCTVLCLVLLVLYESARARLRGGDVPWPGTLETAVATLDSVLIRSKTWPVSIDKITAQPPFLPLGLGGVCVAVGGLARGGSSSLLVCVLFRMFVSPVVRCVCANQKPTAV